MIDDLRFMILRRAGPVRNFPGGVSPRRTLINTQWNGATISALVKSSIIYHPS